MNANRKDLVMYNLLYPAFLGTFIYTAVDKASQDSAFIINTN